MNSRKTTMPDCAALVPAAGLGTRLGRGPKALLRLNQKTLLEILLDTLQQVTSTIIVAAPADHLDEFQCLAGGKAIIIEGGKERQESIERLIQATNQSMLLIQDVARPFASPQLCRTVLELAIRHGAAGAFLDPMVPVGHVGSDGQVKEYWPRKRAGVFQAPQAYRRDILLHAMKKTGGSFFQSPAEMVIEAGYALAHAPGEYTNLKITTPWDWAIAKKVVAPYLS